tara:strand:+ start:487 stop:825 length:339 start_codon:yes stop_codon:yes gene_type:complete
MKFTAKVKNGSLSFHDYGSLKRYLNGVKGEVWVDIKEAPKSRSPKQNGYYRTILRDLARELGDTEDEMHEVMKSHFKITSTKDLTQEEFTEFLDRIIRWAAGFGYPVRDPRK